MQRPYKLLIALFLTILALPLAAEIRAIWALPWGTNTPQKLDAFLADAVAARQTDVLVEVRYRSDALYQTNRVPDRFPNPEPASYLLNGSDFDLLGHAITEGHKRNLRVHAWLVAFAATPADSQRIAQNYIWRNHRDWLTYDKDGKQFNSRSQFGYFLDPGVPEVQDHLLNVIGDLVSGYPRLDGLQLDYVRYPETKLGWHPVSVARFQSSAKDTGLDFNQWRQQQVTGFVERTRALLDSLAPNLIFSAAVIADYAAAVQYYAQNWLDWLERDLVDYVYPMAYAQDYTEFSRVLKLMERFSLGNRTVVGIRGWRDDNSSLLAPGGGYGVGDVARRVARIRAGDHAGVALFSYDALRLDGALFALADSVYSESIIAALNVAPPQALRPKLTPDLAVIPTPRSYLLDVVIPREGKWILEISDPDSRVLHRREKYYLKGINLDYWNGVLPEGTSIPAGDYQIRLWREADGFVYLMQASLEGLAG